MCVKGNIKGQRGFRTLLPNNDVVDKSIWTNVCVCSVPILLTINSDLIRFDFLFFTFPQYDDLTVRFITCTMKGIKIPFNSPVEQKLFKMGLEFTKRDTKNIFQVNHPTI